MRNCNQYHYFFSLKKYVLSQKKGLQKRGGSSAFPSNVAGLIEKETLAQVFSCEFCQISKNSFSYRTPPMAASDTGIFKFSLLWGVLTYNFR